MSFPHGGSEGRENGEMLSGYKGGKKDQCTWREPARMLNRTQGRGLTGKDSYAPQESDSMKTLYTRETPEEAGRRFRGERRTGFPGGGGKK